MFGFRGLCEYLRQCAFFVFKRGQKDDPVVGLGRAGDRVVFLWWGRRPLSETERLVRCQSAAAQVTDAIRRGTTQNTPPMKNQFCQHNLPQIAIP